MSMTLQMKHLTALTETTVYIYKVLFVSSIKPNICKNSFCILLHS